MTKYFTISALPTSFKNDIIDYDSIYKLIDKQAEAKIDGLVIAGSTGEMQTLSHEEWCTLLLNVFNYIKNNDYTFRLIANCGTSSTKTTLENVLIAQKIGFTEVLIATPYYNKPNQDNIFEHFKYINDNVNVDIIMYTVPSRTGVDINSDTVIKIVNNCSNIIGIKDASGNIGKILTLRNIRKNFDIFCGEDYLSIPFNASGGNGIISIASNFIPYEFIKLQHLMQDNNYHEALNFYQDKILDLVHVLSYDTNPIIVKYILYYMKIFNTYETRMPLMRCADSNIDKIKEILIKYNIN